MAITGKIERFNPSLPSRAFLVEAMKRNTIITNVCIAAHMQTLPHEAKTVFEQAVNLYSGRDVTK